MNHLPKVELHLHLDCSLSFEAAAQIAPSISRRQYENKIVAPPKCANLVEYLRRTAASVALLQTEKALRIAVAGLMRRLAEDGVIYAELRFAPLLHLQRNLTPEKVVEVIDEATAAASADTGVEARLILCALRHYTAEQSLATARLAEQFAGSRVVALDLAGDEAGFPLDAHVAAYEYVAARGIHRTAHAGEARGPQSVIETLDRLAPSRIGHGVRSIEDAALVARLKADDIHLEVCPACNVQIDLYPAYRDHPIDKLYRAGVSFSVNTDARGVTPTTLSADYDALGYAFGWRERDLLAVNRHALRAAFAPDDLKAALEQKLRDGYGGAA